MPLTRGGRETGRNEKAENSVGHTEEDLDSGIRTRRTRKLTENASHDRQSVPAQSADSQANKRKDQSPRSAGKSAKQSRPDDIEPQLEQIRRRPEGIGDFGCPNSKTDAIDVESLTSPRRSTRTRTRSSLISSSEYVLDTASLASSDVVKEALAADVVTSDKNTGNAEMEAPRVKVVKDEVAESRVVIIEDDNEIVDELIEGDIEEIENLPENQSLVLVEESAKKMDNREQKRSIQQGGQEERNNREDEEEDGDGDGPPKLLPEEGPGPEEILMAEMMERQQILHDQGYFEGQYIQVQSPGGTQQLIQLSEGDQELPEGTMFIEEESVGGGANGALTVVDENTSQFADDGADLRTVEFNFLDNKNICCGLCGEIVPYEQLMSDHLPNNHPEVLGDGDMQMEEVPYEEWLRDKLRTEKRAIESGFKLSSSMQAPARVHRNHRLHRRVSQIRVNPIEMSLSQLDVALKKKMVEKMGRKVPVTLVDKTHARCGLCNAVVSLNKKFEVVHLVRHFNAWHPSAHRCAGTWNSKSGLRPDAKPLSMHDFAVIDSNNSTPDNLQCIWCGMFMDTDSLAMHFDEVHPDDIEVPKCNLCLQELVYNARMQEKFGEDFEITLPDEHHIRSGKFNSTFSSEAAMERGIAKRLARKSVGNTGIEEEDDEDEDMDESERPEETGPDAFCNSRMNLGKRKKPKRQFIMPALRQAAPIDSQYVEPVTECHWKCKVCQGDILAAVISAGAIRHYRTTHPEQLDDMQYELCKARLERVSDGCMEFVHPQLIECLLCNMTYNLHRPFNMCRAIRHLKSKHPNLMPEYSTVNTGIPQTAKPIQVPPAKKKKGAEEGTDAATLQMLKDQFGVDMDKVQAVSGLDGEQVFVLMPDGEDIDEDTAEQLAAALANGEAIMEVVQPDENKDDTNDEQLLKGMIQKNGDERDGTSGEQQPLVDHHNVDAEMNSPNPMPEPLTEGEN